MIKYRFPPIFVHSSRLISLGKYREFVYDKLGFSDYHPKTMVQKDRLPVGIMIVMNATYGHRHFLAIKDNKILGITVTSAGWRTELLMWEDLGYNPILFENKEWSRSLTIIDLLMASGHGGGHWVGGIPEIYPDMREIRY